MSTIGERLKASRESKGLLQSELAKLIGVKSANVISNWEKDVCKPDANKMVRICQVLDISLSYLLDYYGAQKAPSYSDEAMKLAKDYDEKMDDWGRKQVRDVADNEIARCAAEKVQKAAAVREARESTRREGAAEIAPEQKTPTPIAESGLDVSDECLMEYLQRMDPDLKQYWFDQMRKMSKPQKESLPVSALSTDDDKTPESERPDPS